MTPESRTPAFVEIFDRAVFLFQPFTELCLAQRAVAFSTELVGDVPQHNRRMFAESLG